MLARKAEPFRHVAAAQARIANCSNGSRAVYPTFRKTQFDIER